MKKSTRKIFAIIGVICILSSVFPFMAIMAEDTVIPIDDTSGVLPIEETGFSGITPIPDNGHPIFIVDNVSINSMVIPTAVFIDDDGKGIFDPEKDKLYSITPQDETIYDFTGYNIYAGARAEGATPPPTTQDTHIIMLGGTIGDLYGGGYRVDLNANVTLDIRGGTINGNVYGGGNGADVVEGSGRNIDIDISGATVGGSVYGGGKDAAVNSADITINISNSSIAGDVSGHGSGSAGKVESGASYIDVVDTTIGGNVYGSNSTHSELTLGGATTVSGAQGVIINSSNIAVETRGVDSIAVSTTLSGAENSINVTIPQDPELGPDNPIVTNSIENDLKKFNFMVPSDFIKNVVFEPVNGNVGNIVLRQQLPTPVISVDFVDETLTGFESGKEYGVIEEITGSDPTVIIESHTDGKDVSLTLYGGEDGLFDKKIMVNRRGDDIKTIDSDFVPPNDGSSSPAQVFPIPTKDVIPNADVAITSTNGTLKVTGLKSGEVAQYSEAGADVWHTLVGGEKTNLKAGNYDVRIGAVPHVSFEKKTSTLNPIVVEASSDPYERILTDIVYELEHFSETTFSPALTQVNYADKAALDGELTSIVSGIISDFSYASAGSSYNVTYEYTLVEAQRTSVNPAEWDPELTKGTSADPDGTPIDYQFIVDITLTYEEPDGTPAEGEEQQYKTITKKINASRNLFVKAEPYGGVAMDATRLAIEEAPVFEFEQTENPGDAGAIENETQAAQHIYDMLINGGYIKEGAVITGGVSGITVNNFVAAQKGTQSNKAGTPGSFSYTVKISSTEDPSLAPVTAGSDPANPKSANIIAWIFSGLTDKEAVDALVAIIGEADPLSFPMASANEAEDVSAEIAELINALPGASETGIEMKAVGSVSIPSDYVPAVVGTEENPDGESREFQFTAVVMKGNERAFAYNTCTVVATPYGTVAAREAISNAAELIETSSLVYEQQKVQSAESAKAESVIHINTLIASTGIEVDERDIEETNFAAAQEGTTERPDGTNGVYDFKVHLEKGGETGNTSVVSAIIRAYAIPGQSTSEILARAKTAAEAAEYADTRQADTPDEDSVKAYIREIAEEAIDNTGVTVQVNGVEYIAPTSGTQETPDGTNGSLKFTLTLERNDLSETTAEKTVNITATKYGDDDPEAPGVKPPVTEDGESKVDIVVDPDDPESLDSETTVDPEEFEEAVDSAIEEAEKEGTTPTVEVEVNTPSGATSADVILPVDQLEKLANVDGSKLVVESGLGKIEFDHEALKKLVEHAKAAGGENVHIYIGKIADKSSLTASQQEAVGESTTYELHVTCEGQKITEYSPGKLTITLPEPIDMSGAKEVAVYHIPSEGEAEKLTTSHSTSSKIVTFSTNHLSIFFISHSADAMPEPTPEPSSGGSGSSSGSGSGTSSGTSEDIPSTTSIPAGFDGDADPTTGDKGVYMVMFIGLLSTGIVMLLMAGARKITRDPSQFA